VTAAVTFLASRILLPHGYRLNVIENPDAEPRYAITSMQGTRLLGGASWEGSLDIDDVTVLACFVAEGKSFTELLEALPGAVERIEATGDMLHRGVAYSRQYG